MDVIILNEKSFHGSGEDIKQFIIGSTIKNIRRRAKVLLIDLSTDYSLVVHLKMTGQIVVRGANNWAGGHPNESFVEDLPNKSTRIYLTFDDGAKLFFNDQRKFGWIKLIPTITIDELAFISKLGPEPLIGNPAEEFLTRVRRRNNTTIKAAILDQSVIAGIGNIYADEALWRARLHGSRPTERLTRAQGRAVLTAATDVMNAALAAGGTSFDALYVNVNGASGYFDRSLAAYGQADRPCPRCGTPIRRESFMNRSSFSCPRCQPSPRVRANLSA